MTDHALSVITADLSKRLGNSALVTDKLSKSPVLGFRDLFSHRRSWDVHAIQVQHLSRLKNWGKVNQAKARY